MNITWNHWNDDQIWVDIVDKNTGGEVSEAMRSVENRIMDMLNEEYMEEGMDYYPDEIRKQQLRDLAQRELQWEESHTINQAIIRFYVQIPPMHKTCLSTDVSSQTIHTCFRTYGPVTAFMTDHDGMTPLHILTMNPHATPASILTCLNLNINAAFMRDDSDMMPMDYLWKYERLESLFTVIQSLCLHRDAHGQSFQRHSSSTRKRVKMER